MREGQKPNQKQEAEVAKNLKKLKAGRLPVEIFYQIARLAVLPSIEVIPFRRRGKDIEVLLTQRPETDPYWGNRLHTPGAIIIPTDKSKNFAEAKKRVCVGELKMPKLVNKLVLADFHFHHTSRGVNIWFNHWVEMPPHTPGKGAYHLITKLPRNLIPEQRENILRVAKHFKRYAKHARK